MRTIERRIRHFAYSNKRLRKQINETQKLINQLKKTATWIEEHKTWNPTEFYAVIKQYEAWNKGRLWLLNENKELLAKLRKEVK